jgi:hypothetical protein
MYERYTGNEEKTWLRVRDGVPLTGPTFPTAVIFNQIKVNS